MDKTIRQEKTRAGRQRRSSSSSEEDVRADLERERERLIHQRQSVVARVLDKHDDLVRAKDYLSCRPIDETHEQVRELFHLERFVSLLSYSPEVCL